MIQEMTGPIGIPDFTALVGPAEALEARLLLDTPPLTNRSDAEVAAACAVAAPRSSAVVARRLGWPEPVVRRRLAGLVEQGALRELAPDRYVRKAEITPLGRLYAVEAKLRDAGAALAQVRSYGAWADGCVLVLGQVGAVALERLVPKVLADGAGLVVDGEWRCRPRLVRHGAARRLWAAEHVVAAMADGSYQPSVAP